MLQILGSMKTNLGIQEIMGSRKTLGTLFFPIFIFFLVSCDNPKKAHFDQIRFYGIDSIIDVRSDILNSINLDSGEHANPFITHFDSILSGTNLEDSCFIKISEMRSTLNDGNADLFLKEYRYNSACSNSFFTSFVFDQNNNLVFCINNNDESPGFEVYLKESIPTDSFVLWFRQDTTLLFSRLFKLKAGAREIKFTT
jgi:hypothetical protein